MMTEEAARLFVAAHRGVLSPATIRWYERSLKPFLERFGDQAPDEINVHAIRQWRAEMLESRSPVTVHGYLRACRRLFNWMVEEGMLEKTPCDRVKFPALPTQSPKHVTEKDFRKMLWACRKSRYPRRDRALLLFLADTGARIGGVAGLTLDDLDFDHEARRGRARVVEKGEKERIVPFGAATYDALQTYLNVREQIPEPTHWTSGPELWLGRQGPLTYWGLYQILQRLAKNAGIKGRFNPHAFRHRFARVWLERGGNLAMLSQALGHEDSTITTRYYARWSRAEIERWHQQLSPAQASVS